MSSRHSRLLTTLLLLLAGFGRAQEPPARLDIKLANVRWQHAPREVQGVCVGPDGRTWYQLAPETNGQNLDQIKRRLEKEWRETTPQVSGVKLVLLEPGRAWFLTERGQSLLGYDGQSWVEHPAPDKSFFYLGACPAEGSMLINPAHATPGRVWFPIRGGMHSFDGKEWTVHDFADKVDVNATVPKFAVSPSGKFAAVVYGREPVLWTWLDEKWTKGPGRAEGGEFPVDHFYVSNRGRIWFLVGDELRRIPLPGVLDDPLDGPPGQPLDAIAALVKQLGDEDFARRDEASQKLAEMGPPIRLRLATALETVDDAEIKIRLKKIIAGFAPAKGAKGPRIPVIAAVGKYQVSEVKQFAQDDQGTLYIAAAKIQSPGGPPEPGLLLIDAAGRMNRISNPAGLENWWKGGQRQEFYLRSGTGIWLSQYAGLLSPACFDLQRNELTAVIPDRRSTPVQAVDKEGRVYSRGMTFPGPPSLMVFSPGGSEHRLPLDGDKVAVIRGSEPFVALDGSIWVQRRDNGLSRFAGEEWAAVDTGSENLTPVTSGEDGIVLFAGADRHYLYQKDKLLGKGTIRTLIQEHRALLAKAFSTPRSSQYSLQQIPEFPRKPAVVLAADKGGNIWLLDDKYKVAVLSGDKWIEADQPLKGAGAPTGTARFMAPFGDNSRLYFSSMPPRPAEGNAKIGGLQDGKLAFQDAPSMTGESTLPCGLRDRRGVLWLAADRPKSGINVGKVDQMSFRITKSGAVQEIQQSGLPMLVDDDDAVWLGRIFGRPLNELCLWQDGKIVQHLEVPGTDCVHSLFAEKPGSVYAWTTLGLIHLAKEADGNYQAGQTYSLPELAGFRPPLFSRLGYVVVPTSSGFPPEPQLTLVRLP